MVLKIISNPRKLVLNPKMQFQIIVIYSVSSLTFITFLKHLFTLFPHLRRHLSFSFRKMLFSLFLFCCYRITVAPFDSKATCLLVFILKQMIHLHFYTFCKLWIAKRFLHSYVWTVSLLYYFHTNLLFWTTFL